VVSFKYLFPKFFFFILQADPLETHIPVQADNAVQKVERTLSSVCTSGKWNTDGCTYVPDLFLNFEACVMHDLCYITPGATKVGICVFIWILKTNTIP
jgi:hypothetical protein